MLVVDEKKCTGCGSCMVACVFHHTHSFGRSPSSITIKRFLAEGRVQIHIWDRPEDKHLACDQCKQPLCAEFCFTQAIRHV